MHAWVLVEREDINECNRVCFASKWVRETALGYLCEIGVTGPSAILDAIQLK